jgi:hypothetical protein
MYHMWKRRRQEAEDVPNEDDLPEELDLTERQAVIAMLVHERKADRLDVYRTPFGGSHQWTVWVEGNDAHEGVRVTLEEWSVLFYPALRRQADQRSREAGR